MFASLSTGIVYSSGTIHVQGNIEALYSATIHVTFYGPSPVLITQHHLATRVAVN